jgi:hypothetical protein
MGWASPLVKSEGDASIAVACEERVKSGRSDSARSGRHALAAGQQQKAYALAERSLYGASMTQGRASVVLDWLARMPPARGPDEQAARLRCGKEGPSAKSSLLRQHRCPAGSK